MSENIESILPAAKFEEALGRPATKRERVAFEAGYLAGKQKEAEASTILLEQLAITEREKKVAVMQRNSLQTALVALITSEHDGHIEITNRLINELVGQRYKLDIKHLSDRPVVSMTVIPPEVDGIVQ